MYKRQVQDGAGEENDHIDQSQQDNGDDVLDFRFIGVCSTHGKDSFLNEICLNVAETAITG